MYKNQVNKEIQKLKIVILSGINVKYSVDHNKLQLRNENISIFTVSILRYIKQVQVKFKL